jgi:predicted nuclease with TOPRIM domain
MDDSHLTMREKALLNQRSILLKNSAMIETIQSNMVKITEKIDNLTKENINLKQENDCVKENNKLILDECFELKKENKMLQDELDKIYKEMLERYFSTPKFLLDKLRNNERDDDKDD